MNPNRNTIYIIIILFLFSLLVASIFVIIQGSPTLIPDKKDTDSLIYDNVTVIILNENLCESCHLSGKSSIPQAETVKPHVNGGAYCLTCHEFKHDIHPLDNNVTCEKCHGTSGTKPSFVSGSISCNNCHSYPDPLIPSKGNLLTIHKPRGISCTTCHTNKCTDCHSVAGSDQSWDKRRDHFSTLMVKIR